MNKLLVAASALTIGMIATQAYADTATGERWPRWYVGLSGGMTFLGDTDVKGDETGKINYSDGGIGTLSLGYMPPFPGAFGNLRLEAELGYHYNSIDRAVNGTTASSNGMTRDESYMGNLYYDFRNSSQLTPYIGAGAGGARVGLSRNSGFGVTGSEDNVFAYQFLAGISYTPTTIPMTEWTLGYRYFTATSPEFNNGAAGHIKLDDQVAQSAEIGAKFRF